MGLPVHHPESVADRTLLLFRIRVFHQRKLKPLAILKYHTESVFGLDFSPDNAHFVSASKDHKIALWSLYPPATDKAATQSLRQY